MREVKYNFRSSAFEDLIDNDYETINEGLIRKYGSPLGYSNGDCYIFIGGALESVTFHLALIQFIDGFGDLQDYDEWDVTRGIIISALYCIGDRVQCEAGLAASRW